LEPPSHLSDEAKGFWENVLQEYELADWHCRVLQVALEAWDRMCEARETLARDGSVYRDRFNAPRKHPSVSIEEAARLQFLRAMRELDLDGAPLPDPRLPRR
jgi:P27 family predicted phage terminase small subunit